MSLGRSLKLMANSSVIKNMRNIANASTAANNLTFKTLEVTNPSEYVFHVKLNRPDKRNAMNPTLFYEIKDCFQKLQNNSDCRSIIISGSGKCFSSGLDLSELTQITFPEIEEIGRKAFAIRNLLIDYQSCLTSIEICPKPVIGLIHGFCIGGGLDLITACDIRYCTKDSWFSIKEVDMGLAADIGTLQRLPKVTGNDSLARELIYTSRKFNSDEAKTLGLVSKVVDDDATLFKDGLELAKTIASKSPIAVQGSKVNLVYSRDHTVEEGLRFMTIWNGSMLQSEDVIKSAMAQMAKEQATFSKL